MKTLNKIIEEQLNILREVIETAYDIEHPDEDTKSYLFRKYRGRFAEFLKKAQEEAVSGLISFVFTCTQPDNGDEFSTVDKWVSTYINCKGDFNEYLKTLK